MQLKRRLNLFDATLLVIGNVVGAGIFTTSGFLAGELPQPLFFIAIWVIGGLLTIMWSPYLCRDGGHVSSFGRRLPIFKGGVWPRGGFSPGLGQLLGDHPRFHRSAIYCDGRLRKRFHPF